jgi:hypothetical protein
MEWISKGHETGMMVRPSAQRRIAVQEAWFTRRKWKLRRHRSIYWDPHKTRVSRSLDVLWLSKQIAHELKIARDNLISKTYSERRRMSMIVTEDKDYEIILRIHIRILCFHKFV